MKILTWSVIIWTFLVTIARAIRLPNDFSEAYWLLDYRFGFIKRGLVGTICHLITALFDTRMSPGLIVILSFITFMGMIIAFLVILSRINRVSLGLVFASSPFVVISAHLFGYFDALMFVLAIISAALVLRGRPLWAALVSVIAIFSHESYLLAGFPLVCLALFLMLERNKKNRVGYILSFLVPVAAFVVMVVLQQLTTDAKLLRPQIAQHLNSFGFVQTRSGGVARWETTTFFQFFQEQSGDFWERLVRGDVLPVVVPSLLFFLIFILSLKLPRATLFATLAAVLSPLLLHAVAWDTARISTYTIGCAFVAIWILAETHRLPASPLLLPIALVVFLINGITRVLLMDGEVDRFSNSTRFLIYSPAIVYFLLLALRGEIASHRFKKVGNYA